MSRSLSKMRRMSVNAIRVVLGSALKLPLLRCQVSWLQKMSQPQLPVYQSAIRSREPSFQGQHRLPQPASSLQLGGKSRREKMDSLCVCHRDVFCAWRASGVYVFYPRQVNVRYQEAVRQWRREFRRYLAELWEWDEGGVLDIAPIFKEAL
uniref:uncharacterized protein LOC117603039 isoform X3 n=1 Tax=Osmia lignaria TaxID=473952 RepID=UPI001478D2D3|nr:uncharacterized protein LOC117603039 isoform X3 [Osmia lignaria]